MIIIYIVLDLYTDTTRGVADVSTSAVVVSYRTS